MKVQSETKEVEEEGVQDSCLSLRCNSIYPKQTKH